MSTKKEQVKHLQKKLDSLAATLRKKNSKRKRTGSLAFMIGQIDEITQLLAGPGSAANGKKRQLKRKPLPLFDLQPFPALLKKITPKHHIHQTQS